RVAGTAPEDGPPALDLDLERRLQAFAIEAAERGLLTSAQDVSGGGFAVAVAEAAMWGRIGARVRLPVASSPAVDLFGESPSRLVVSADARHAPALALLARQHGLPVEPIGTVGGDRLVVELAGAGATGAAEERGSSVADSIDVPLADLVRAWEHGLPRALGWDEAGQAHAAATAEGR
ncbi:MAG TPA: AIR synthase-related protein, partial [Candidatus Binatia bacterium]|nr:AIR synthase-related protein [Candidatus Binatia bacterium]